MINQISKLHEKYFLSINERIESLNKFKESILSNEEEIYQALKLDLNKSKKEVYLSEIAEVIGEIEYHIKNLKKWSKKIKVKDTYQVMGTKSFLIRKPKGKVLIISPFNYPINLCFIPLIGSISGGNNSLVKPSPKTPNTNKVIFKIIDEAFSKSHVTYIKEEDLKNHNDLYNYNPDLIFFTGSTSVGKIIEKNAVERGIEFVTELGGKCPCIIDNVYNDDVYKRIVWGKFMNAGQTCVSINHILYNENLKDFEQKLINEINIQYHNPLVNHNIPKIISSQDFERVKKILSKYNDKIIYGGNYDEKSLIVEPTIIKCSVDDILNTEEVFAPIIFICPMKNISEMINASNLIDASPLAAYIYSNSKKSIELFIKKINSGSYCINDSMSQILNHNLPFGGVKTSGNGRYHGYWSFETFTYLKPILVNNQKKSNNIKFINNEIDLEKTKKLISFVKKFKE